MSLQKKESDFSWFWIMGIFLIISFPPLIFVVVILLFAYNVWFQNHHMRLKCKKQYPFVYNLLVLLEELFGIEPKKEKHKDLYLRKKEKMERVQERKKMEAKYRNVFSSTASTTTNTSSSSMKPKKKTVSKTFSNPSSNFKSIWDDYESVIDIMERNNK